MLTGKFIKYPKLILNFLFKKPWSSRQGFSLIETLIALSILIIAVLALVQLFPMGLKASYKAKQITVATNLAQAKVEEIISQSYSQINPGTYEEASLSTIDNDFSNYGRITVISFVDENLNQTVQESGLKKVEVFVTWPDQYTNSRSTTTLTTLITEL